MATPIAQFLRQARQTLQEHPGGPSDVDGYRGVSHACYMLAQLTHSEIIKIRLAHIERLAHQLYGRQLSAQGIKEVRKIIVGELDGIQQMIDDKTQD